MEQHDPSNPYQQPQIETTTVAPAEQPNMVLSIVSLVLSILSIPGWCCMLYIPLSIAAIVTGFMGMQKVKAGTGGGRGMALAGVIIGGIVLVLFSIAYVAIVVLQISMDPTF